MENNVVCDGSIPEMFRQTFKSGVAFRAKRWMLTMERHYDRYAVLQKQQNQLLGQPLLHNSKLVFCFFLVVFIRKKGQKYLFTIWNILILLYIVSRSSRICP